MGGERTPGRIEEEAARGERREVRAVSARACASGARQSTHSFSSWIRLSVSSVVSSSAPRAALVCEFGRAGRDGSARAVGHSAPGRRATRTVTARSNSSRRAMNLRATRDHQPGARTERAGSACSLVPVLVRRLVDLGLACRRRRRTTRSAQDLTELASVREPTRRRCARRTFFLVRLPVEPPPLPARQPLPGPAPFAFLPFLAFLPPSAALPSPSSAPPRPGDSSFALPLPPEIDDARGRLVGALGLLNDVDASGDELGATWVDMC